MHQRIVVLHPRWREDDWEEGREAQAVGRHVDGPPVGPLRALGREEADRLWGSLAVAAWAIAQGVNIVRVHDVAETVDAVRMVEAIKQAT